MRVYNYKSLVQYITNQGINLAESFDDWTKLAFSLSNLGEEGRALFHSISAISAKYNEMETERKFTEALRSNRKTDISTLVWMAQKAGVDTNQFYSNKEVSVPFVAPIRKGIQQRKLCTIPFEFVEKSASFNSDLVCFLCGIFDKHSLESPTIERLVNDYCLGATKNRDVIFWQVDVNGKVRTGKAMMYNKETGHRVKEQGSIKWIHTTLKKQGAIPAEWELTQCLFGEHLLRIYPNNLVCLVESEKTAVIAAGIYPEYIWLATGGKCNMSLEKLSVLKDRVIILFPDVDGFQYWTEKADDMRKIGCKTVVSDLLERIATAEDRANKIDIADLLIRQLEGVEIIEKELSVAGQTLAEFEKQNPFLTDLITVFDCCLIEHE